MSYSTCREHFTPQQIGRMKCFLHNNRQLNAISGGVEGVASKFESKESGNNSGVNGKDNNNRNIKINPLVFLIRGVGVVFGLALVSFYKTTVPGKIKIIVQQQLGKISVSLSKFATQ